MKKLIGLALVICTWTTVALAQDAAAKKPAKAGSPAEELKQIEHNWTEAQKAADANKIGAYIADDWAGYGPDGSKMDKTKYLAAVKSGDIKVESVEVGPMDVRMMGNVGVVLGSDTEKSTMNGKDSSGKYVWMDVFEKKGGKWQAVRSEITRVQE